MYLERFPGADLSRADISQLLQTGGRGRTKKPAEEFPLPVRIDPYKISVRIIRLVRVLNLVPIVSLHAVLIIQIVIIVGFKLILVGG